MTKKKDACTMDFGTAGLAAFLLIIILLPEALLNYDWNDWWESLAIRLSEGQTIYADQQYFSGPLYPGLIKLFVRQAGLTAGVAVKATSCIGLAILVGSVIPPLEIALQEWYKVFRLTSHNRINRRLSKYCSALIACIFAVGGTIYLFSSFLRVDDYHIFRMAGFNLVLASSYKLLYQRREAKIPLSLMSGAGIGLVMAARLHEGIALLVLCSLVIFVVSRDKRTAATFCFNTLALSGLITLAIGGWLGGLTEVREVDGLISATMDSAKAKTGTGVNILIERAINLTIMSIGIALEFAKKMLKAILILGISMVAWEALSAPHKIPFNNLGKKVILFRKEIRLTARNLFLCSLLIGTIFILHNIFLEFRLAYKILVIGCACMAWKALRNSERNYPRCGSYTDRLMFSAAMCSTPIIAGLASSSMRLEIDYGLAYLYFYGPLAICSLQELVMAARNSLHLNLKNQKWYTINWHAIMSIAQISILCISIYSMFAVIAKRLVIGWQWWGSGPSESLPVQIYNYASKRNTHDRPVESRLLNDNIFWSKNALPNSFFREIVELCSYFEDFQTGKPVTVWSYPSPMPAVGCSNTKHEKSSRYTLWYDVTGNKSALKELKLLQGYMPDSIVIYDIAGAYEAHANAFGGINANSAMSIMARGVEEVIRKSYDRTKTIKTRYGELYIYLRRDLARTITRLPNSAIPTAKIRL